MENNNMAQQIEPVIILCQENFPYSSDNRVRAEILDNDSNVLFTSMLNAKSYEEVAEQLNLTLINKQ